ncbi:Mitochondrial import receptor subunit tom-70 [Termitomyces sp. J132]|nr:Mitochondrial import receptor subunit tom-70 [Termitomyces sp. J132]
MEVEQSLESNGNAHEVLIKTLEIVRAQNKLSHELEQINVAHALLKEEASAIEQSLSTKLKEVACLKAEWSVYSRFTLDLPDRERDILAKALKEDGNRAYESEEFTLAVSFYSRAIETSSKYDATFYANRAACYLRMTPQVPHLAVQDCSEAIQHSPTYVKAIHRRGTAYEILERFDDALDDFITTTSLDLTGITKDLGSVDRLLKKFATEKASEILDNKDTSLPPFSVASTYFASFRARMAGDIALLKSLEAISLADYQSAMLLVNEALDRGISISWRQGRATARNLRGTFKRVNRPPSPMMLKYLLDDLPAAKSDFLSSLSIYPDLTQNFIKFAKIRFEQDDEEAAFKCFENAIIRDGDNPDIYHHRGQESIILGLLMILKSLSALLHAFFMPSHVRLAAAYFGLKEFRRGESTLRSMLDLFPNRSEPLNYLGELHLSQHHYKDAIEMFEHAFEMKEHKAVAYIDPLLNKGRTLFQWKHDVGSAKACYMEAFYYDPDTLAATAMISELHLECGDLDKAASKIWWRSLEIGANRSW